jgi:hypothetical protein
MEWEIEYTDEFGQWWDGLSEGEQESRHGNMRELPFNYADRPNRMLYAFQATPNK